MLIYIIQYNLMYSLSKKSAIVILAARINILQDTLKFFYQNWNDNYKCPIYIYTFGKLISDKKKGEIHNKVDSSINFFEIFPQIPKHIKEEDLFYNRIYHEYVRKSFSKKRLGFLHMCHFLLNLVSFGSNDLKLKELEQYDCLMWIDDETYFKKKINENFFIYSEKFPIVTASKTELKKTKTNLAVIENLWKFYRNYVLQHNIKPKSKLLSSAVINDNEEILFEIDWPCGSTEIFNLTFFRDKNWQNFLNAINMHGGIYKYRWNPGYLITLYLMTYFENPIYNLNYVDRDIVNFKIPGSNTPVYFNYPDIYNSRFLGFLHRNFLKPIKTFKQIIFNNFK